MSLLRGPHCHNLIVRLFFFNDTATTEIYTLSLHDALPISSAMARRRRPPASRRRRTPKLLPPPLWGDRKSTRLNSSHGSISYAVFCLKKKNKILLHPRFFTKNIHDITLI